MYVILVMALALLVFMSLASLHVYDHWCMALSLLGVFYDGNVYVIICLAGSLQCMWCMRVVLVTT
jgi:hypothetical protein